MSFLAVRTRSKMSRVTQPQWEAMCQTFCRMQLGLNIIDNSMKRRVSEPISGAVCEFFASPQPGLIYWRICDAHDNGRRSERSVQDGHASPFDAVVIACSELARRRAVRLGYQNINLLSLSVDSCEQVAS